MAKPVRVRSAAGKEIPTGRAARRPAAHAGTRTRGAAASSLALPPPITTIDPSPGTHRDPRRKPVGRRIDAGLQVRLVAERFQPSRGGAERSLLEIACHLARLGVDVEVLCGRAEELEGEPDFVVRTLDEEHPTRLPSLRRLRAAVYERAGDGRIVHAITPAVPCHLYQVRAGLVPDVLEQNVRGRDGARAWLAALDARVRPKWAALRAWEADLAGPSGSAHVATLSARASRRVRELYGTPEGRVHVIPNGADPPPFQESERHRIRRRERDALGLGAEETVALFVGHDFRRKGLRVLLDAIARLPEERRPRLLVAGRDDPTPYAAAVRAIDARLLGAVSPLWPLYLTADLVVLPSLFDPFSRVGLEAMHCGCAAIVSARDGLAELVRNGREACILRDPEDVGELAAHLDRLVDADFRATLAEAGRRKVTTLTMGTHAQRLVALYRHLLQGGRGMLRSSE